jgi:cell division control protein 6
METYLYKKVQSETWVHMASDGKIESVFGMCIENQKIFRDENCLDKGYRPELKEILHREAEKAELIPNLSKALKGVTPSNMLVYGKTGTGKTMLLRVLTKQLEKEALEYSFKVKTIHIVCNAIPTNVGVVKELISQLEAELYLNHSDIKSANSFDSYFKKLCILANKYEGQLIIILDEVDKLENDELINNLARAKENEFLDRNIAIIGITNDIKYDEKLDPRTKSVLGQRDIMFSPYNADQLRDILYQRAEKAFNPGVLEDNIIPLCAAYAAQEHGDARKAIELLVYSGNVAEEQHADKVTENHVDLAKERIETDKTTEFIRTLPTQSKLVFAACIFNVSQKPQTCTYTGEVYSSYKQMAQEIGIEVLTQRRVTDLISELGMSSLLNVTEIFKGRYGRTREVTLTIIPSIAWYILMEDDRLKDLERTYTPDKLKMMDINQASLREFQ